MNLGKRRVEPPYKIKSPFPLDITMCNIDENKRSKTKPLSPASPIGLTQPTEEDKKVLELVSTSCKLLDRNCVPYKKSPMAKRQFRL